MTAKPPRVAIAQPIHPDGRAVLAEHCDLIDGDGWKDSLAEVDGLIVRNAQVSADDLSVAGCLKIIARVGVGTDSIDLAEAVRRGIPVAITPDANAVAVAEHTFALVLAMQRKLVEGGVLVRSGRFGERDGLLGRTLACRVLGVVGYGRIGQRVVKLADAFGMTCLIYDPMAKPDINAPHRFVHTLQDLLAVADIVTLHAPLTEATRGLISANELATMKAGAYLVNTARAPLVDYAALADALNRGHLAGAAIDVYGGPPGMDHPLCGTSAVLTPHVAAMTEEAFAGMSVEAAKAVLTVLRGGRPRHVINPESLAEQSIAEESM